MAFNNQRLPSNTTTTSRQKNSSIAEVLLPFSTGFLSAAAVIGIVWYGYEIFQQTKSKGDNNDGASNTTQNDDRKNEMANIRFPWEPVNNKQGQEGGSKGDNNAQQSNKKRLCPNPSDQDQLQFLAQMTFANGGIRTPTCLCCL